MSPQTPSTPNTLAGASSASQAALELPSLLALIAHRAASDLGRAKVERLAPFADPNGLRRHRRRYQEAARLLAARALVPYSERAFGPILQELAKGGGRLRGRDLVEVPGETLFASIPLGDIDIEPRPHMQKGSGGGVVH